MYLNEEKQCCSLTILTGIHADGINVCEVGHWRLHGSTGRPHVVEEEDGHSREAKHTEPCHTQDVCEEHKLKTKECHSVIKPFLKCALFKKKKKSVVVFTYHSTDASSTDGGLELAVQFLDCASCIETLSKQNDPIEEEK